MTGAGSFTVTGVGSRNINPFRQPDWRWSAATASRINNKRLKSFEDPSIGDAMKFQRALNAADTFKKKDRAIQRWPHLAVAHQIFVADGVSRHEIEARLLAGEIEDVIAKKAGVDAAVIRVYEQLFFNVSASLHAHGWLLANALKISTWRRPVPTEGEGWKWLAIAGGSFVLDLVIADFLGRVEPEYPDRPLLAKKARFCVREYAMGTSPDGTRFFVEEGAELFGKAINTALPTEQRPVVQAQMDLLRLATKLPPQQAKKSNGQQKQKRPQKVAAPKSRNDA